MFTDYKTRPVASEKDLSRNHPFECVVYPSVCPFGNPGCEPFESVSEEGACPFGNPVCEPFEAGTRTTHNSAEHSEVLARDTVTTQHKSEALPRGTNSTTPAAQLGRDTKTGHRLMGPSTIS